MKHHRRFFAIMLAGALLLACVACGNNDRLPPVPRGSMISSDGTAAMGFQALMNTSAAELHRVSPAYGRESELGTMPVYRNPRYGKQMTEAEAMEIAEKFGADMGKTYTYIPPEWLADPELQKAMRDKLELMPPEQREMIENKPLGYWEFKHDDETLTVDGSYGNISLSVPLPAHLPDLADPTARQEAICWQVYELYAAAIEALTGFRFSKISTAFEYGVNEEGIAFQIYTTFLYANDPGDSLARQAEDYAIKRLNVSVIEEPGREAAFLSFDLYYPRAEELLGNYPVLDLEGAKRELLSGNYEAPVEATRAELSRATIEEAEIIYSIRPWSSTFAPMYCLYLTFPPGDMEGWNNDSPYLDRLGLRNYYIFFVPAVPSKYLVP